MPLAIEVAPVLKAFSFGEEVLTDKRGVMMRDSPDKVGVDGITLFDVDAGLLGPLLAEQHQHFVKWAQEPKRTHVRAACAGEFGEQSRVQLPRQFRSLSHQHHVLQSVFIREFQERRLRPQKALLPHCRHVGQFRWSLQGQVAG
jgi:hypothetical protein